MRCDFATPLLAPHPPAEACTRRYLKLALHRQAGGPRGTMGTLESLVFDNVSLRALPTEPLGPDAHTSRTVRGFCYSRCHPVPLNDPVLVCASQECLVSALGSPRRDGRVAQSRDADSVFVSSIAGAPGPGDVGSPETRSVRGLPGRPARLRAGRALLRRPSVRPLFRAARGRRGHVPGRGGQSRGRPMGGAGKISSSCFHQCSRVCLLYPPQ